MTLDSFYETECQSMALARVLEASGPALLITGSQSSGKTHLAHIFAEQHGGIIFNPNTMTDQAVLTAADSSAVVLEDGHRWSQHPSAQATAFHLYNQANDLGQRLLVTGQNSIASWNLTLPDLISRLHACLQISVTNPDETALHMVTAKLFADRQLAVSSRTISFALSRVDRSFASAAQLVAQIDHAIQWGERRVTTTLVKDLIAARTASDDTDGDER
ncbi:MAG: hypothetical protein AAGF71_13985 [Pseudomonadota bacterium]